MKKSDIYEIAIKILGLYLFFTAIGLLNDLFQTFALMMQAKVNPELFSDFDQTPFFALSVGNFMVVVLFASFLTFRTKAIVKYVCKPIDYVETSTLFADRKVIYEIALVVMGLLLIIWTLPDLAFKWKKYIQQTNGGLDTKFIDNSFIVAAAIKIIVGLVSVAFAKTFSALFVRESKEEQLDSTQSVH